MDHSTIDPSALVASPHVASGVTPAEALTAALLAAPPREDA